MFKKMFSDSVCKDFLIKAENKKIHTIKTIGISESALYELVKSLIEKYDDRIKFSFLPHFRGVDLRISSIIKGYIEDALITEIIDKIGVFVYGNEAVSYTHLRAHETDS